MVSPGPLNVVVLKPTRRGHHSILPPHRRLKHRVIEHEVEPGQEWWWKRVIYA